jgi:single-strand DNA-binding protein
MNRLEIIGHIGNDAEIKDLGQNQVINFSVAVSESYTNKQNEKVTSTMWFECAKWGNSTAIAQYLKKGTQVYISGKPNNRGWVNEQGDVKTVNGITVFDIQLLGSKSESTQSSSTASSSTAQTQTNPQQSGSLLPGEEEPDDLPF